jgi:hypothetical protein
MDVIEKTGNRRLDLPTAVEVMAGESDEALRSELDSLLSDMVEREWVIGGEKSHNVITAARVDGSGCGALFVANMTPGDKSLEVKWQGHWPVTFLDAASRKKWTPRQGNGSVRFALPEGESLVILQADDGRPTAPPAHFWEVPADAPSVELGGPWAFEADRPSLYRLRCRVLPDPDGSYAPDSLPADGWLDTDWGDCGVPLTPESCNYYWMAAEFDLETPVLDLQAVVDSEDTLEAYLNGKPLPAPKQATVWEESNLAWDLPAAKRGRNTLLLNVRPSVYHSDSVIGCTPGTGIVSHAPIKPSMTEPVVLRGSFGVREAEAPVLIAMPRELRPGDWNSQGLPHYAGTGIYKVDFDWPGPEGPALFQCQAGADVVEVLLDGASLGKRAWGRRWFEIPGLTQGKHRAEIRITNTLGCILRRTYDAMKYSAQVSGLVSAPIVISMEDAY